MASGRLLLLYQSPGQWKQGTISEKTQGPERGPRGRQLAHSGSNAKCRKEH